MFAYCNNNPVILCDSDGTYPRKAMFLEDLDFEDNHNDERLGDYIELITPQEIRDAENKVGRVINKTLDSGAKGAIENLDSTLFFGIPAVIMKKTKIGLILILVEASRGFIFGSFHGFVDAIQEEWS